MTIAVSWDAKHQFKQRNFGAKENCHMNLSGLSKTHGGSGPSPAYLNNISRLARVMGIFIPDLHMNMYFLQKFKYDIEGAIEIEWPYL